MESDRTQQTLDLRDYARILLKRKSLLIFPLIVTLLAVLAGSYLLQPIYESSTTVLVAETSLLSPTFSRMVPTEERVMNRDQRQEWLATIRHQILSTAYIGQLIEQLGIPVSEQIKKSVAGLHNQFPEISESELARKLQVDGIRKTMKVVFEGSNLVQITAQASTPQSAARRAQALASIFIRESLESELVGVKGAIDFSDEMLEVYRNRLRRSEDKLRRFEQDILRADTGRDSSAVRNLTHINSAKDDVGMELSRLSSDIRSAKSELAEIGLRAPVLSYSGTLTNLKIDALKGMSGLAGLLAKYSWRDAKVVRVNERSHQRLEAVEQEVEKLTAEQFPEMTVAVRQKIVGMEFQAIKMSFLKEKRKVLYAAANKVKGLIALSPSLRQRHNELERSVEEDRRVHELFSEQQTGSRINQAATRAEAETKFRIIEPAAIPIKPVSPNRIKLAGIGALLGLALGLGAILLVEFLDNSFHKVDEVEAYLGLKVIGTIPRMELPLSQKGAGKIWMLISLTVSILLLALVAYLKTQLG